MKLPIWTSLRAGPTAIIDRETSGIQVQFGEAPRSGWVTAAMGPTPALWAGRAASEAKDYPSMSCGTVTLDSLSLP